MSGTDEIRIHARVEGRVQGVGFRHFTWETAHQLNLRGWVRNRWEGSVEVIAEGDRQQIQKFIAALWKGPPMSFVTQVKTLEESITEPFATFEILRSA